MVLGKNKECDDEWFLLLKIISFSFSYPVNNSADVASQPGEKLHTGKLDSPSNVSVSC